MPARSTVIQYVTESMIEAFARGELIDAQNMDAFLDHLGGMTDAEYDALASEECSGAIS